LLISAFCLLVYGNIYNTNLFNDKQTGSVHKVKNKR